MEIHEAGQDRTFLRLSAYQDKTYVCQLEKHTDSPWMWAAPDRSIELILEEDCTVKVTSHQGGKSFQHRAEPSNKKAVISPHAASKAWNQALKTILHIATVYNDPEGMDEVSCAVLEGILQLFEWVSEFCDLFETCLARNRNVLMQPLAEHVAHFLGEVGPECPDTQYFTRFFLGTVLLAGFLGQFLVGVWNTTNSERPQFSKWQCLSDSLGMSIHTLTFCGFVLWLGT